MSIISNLDHLKLLTSNIEQMLEQAGGFFMKPWVYCDHSGRKKAKKWKDGVKDHDPSKPAHWSR